MVNSTEETKFSETTVEGQGGKRRLPQGRDDWSRSRWAAEGLTEEQNSVKWGSKTPLIEPVWNTGGRVKLRASSRQDRSVFLLFFKCMYLSSSTAKLLKYLKYAEGAQHSYIYSWEAFRERGMAYWERAHYSGAKGRKEKLTVWSLVSVGTYCLGYCVSTS